MCNVLCHAYIIYIHSTSPRMSRACIHLGVHNHHASNDTCRESLDMAYKCLANEVMITPTAKSSTIVIAAKQIISKIPPFEIDHNQRWSSPGW